MPYPTRACGIVRRMRSRTGPPSAPGSAARVRFRSSSWSTASRWRAAPNTQTGTVLADGVRRPLGFDVPLNSSAWIAVRVLGAAHTNPMFAIVDGKPIRASRRSAEWCLAAVDQCGTQKVVNIRPAEREDAARAYEHARAVYRRLIEESTQP